MTRKHRAPDDPEEWLNHAKSNLAHAQAVNPEVWFENLCFDAQQAAEKAIKAVFVGRGESFPFVHDLEELLLRLTSNGLKAPKYVWESAELTQYAVVTRYPRRDAPVTRREYKRAVRIATAVLRWAERQVAAQRAKLKGKQ
jgi:HEPN domain-containing protein